jgi:hypothetical protein
MFELARFAGTSGRGIIVQTRKGHEGELENYIAPEVTTQSANLYAAKRNRHPNWIQRKPATGVYNCAGMVWASRRTTLPNPSDWQKVLHEDNYRPLQASEVPHVGDLVIYRRKNHAEILHVASVFSIHRLDDHDPNSRVAIRALSKWDNQSGEDSHALDDLVLNGGEEYVREFWTDRP